MTLSKDPTAMEMVPVATSVTTSLPLPTVGELGPLAGIKGIGGAALHGTSCHSVLGCDAVKQPGFATGTRAMPARQS
jgi:hypothetical protein